MLPPPAIRYQQRALPPPPYPTTPARYRDSDGRLLTTKEAFRQISYKFHGHGPGQKKKEKRRKEVIQMEKTLMDTDKFGTAAAFQTAQRATGKAYIPISGGSVGASMGSAFGDDDEFDLTKKSSSKRKKGEGKR